MIRKKSGNSLAGVVMVVLTLGFLGPIPSYSQVVGGTISGTVFDTAAVVISGAELSILNVATGVTTRITTNGEGIYNAPNLLPGTYTVTISAAGFQTKVEDGMRLAVGAQQELNVTLNLATVSEKVELNWDAPDVQLASSTISGVMNNTTVEELPLNGRSWTDLATLQPGVSTIHAMVSVSSPDRLGRGLGSELSITGGRPQQNNYVLNGISFNDYSNQAPGSLIGGNLGVDAVAEFSILTTNFSTEYGRTSGGVISAISRSGTNEFHGSAYEFLRNSALDARNFFDGSIPPFRRNQFGFSAGGPIKRDKSFIFGDYERLQQSLGLSMVDEIPSLNARQGILCDTNSPDCSKTIKVNVDPSVMPYLRFYPLPNGRLQCDGCVAGAGDTGLYSFSGSQLTNENYFTTRVDHKLSAGDSLSGSYMFDNAPSSQNDEFNDKLILTRTRRQLVTLEENHVFTPYLLNSFRLGYNRVFAASPSGGTAINPLAANKSLGFVPGATAGTIGVTGLTNFTGGLSTTQPAVFGWNSWQVDDNVFLTRGRHSLKVGANVERIQDNQFSSSRPGGDFEFNSLRDFLTNHPASFTADVPGTVTSRGIRETLFGVYLQDDVRFRPNLTINAGLRYEIATVPSEIQGKLASLHSLTGSQIFTGNPLFANPSLRDFEPRVGLSWDPFRTGKTAIRGGLGMFDVQILPANLRVAAEGTAPFYLSTNGSNLSPGSFPSGAFATLSADPTTKRAVLLQQRPPRNYVMQWNLNIQREITPGIVAMIGYVGSRGVHNLFHGDDVSIVLPIAKTPDGYLWPNPAGSGAVLNSNFGRVALTVWDSSSIYHALEFQVKKRMSHGLQAQASYTLGKSIDSSSGSTDGDQFLNGISTLPFFSEKVRRGLSDFNQAQIFTLSYTWDIPSPTHLSGAFGWAARGWGLGGILQANGGVPFTAVIGPDPLGLNNTDPVDFPNRATGCNPIHGGVNYLNLQCFSLPLETPALAGKCDAFGTHAQPAPVPIPGTCANLLGDSGRNSVVGPALVNFDMSLFKNNSVKRISEQFNAQFRIEIFNSLNHANLSPPTANNAIFDGNGVSVPGAGDITSTATASRQIQFALKVIW
jgi:carboxypeptidase family protein/TonB-dependent receptor-like protein